MTYSFFKIWVKGGDNKGIEVERLVKDGDTLEFWINSEKHSMPFDQVTEAAHFLVISHARPVRTQLSIYSL